VTSSIHIDAAHIELRESPRLKTDGDFSFGEMAADGKGRIVVPFFAQAVFLLLFCGNCCTIETKDQEKGGHTCASLIRKRKRIDGKI